MAQALEREGKAFVYLHGGIPGRKRKELISAFHDNADIRIFLSTDAGGTGLNLQNASTVINMDLPWNPAVLEQRIGRIHRIGQHQPVRVVNFVSEGTIEHGMLDVLSINYPAASGRGIKKVLIADFHTVSDILCLASGHNALSYLRSRVSPLYLQNIHPSRTLLPIVAVLPADNA